MSIRHLFSVCATAVLLAVTPGVSAQVPYGGGMGGTGGMARGGYRRGVDPTRKLPTANQLEGPPIPEFFVDRFELDSAQAGKYRALYDSFMDVTAAIRDSAKAARSMIDAGQSGDRLAARVAVPMLMSLGDSLNKADDRFNNQLKTFLTSPQVKAYKKWKDDQRRQEHADDKPVTASSSDPNTQP